MKPSAPFLSLLLRVLVVLTAGALAYMLGWSQPVTPLTPPAAQKNAGPSGMTFKNGVTLRPGSTVPGHAMAIANLIKRDREQGLAELAKLRPGADSQIVYQMVFEMWASGNSSMAAAAAATAYALPPGNNRTDAFNTVLSTWGKTAPKDMLDWAGSLAATDSAPLKDALTEVVSKENEPALAAQYVDKLTDATARNQSIGTIASAMAVKDPAGTMDWLNQVATGTTYDSSVKNLMSGLAKQNPAQAAALVGKITEPGTQANAITDLAATWGATDPQAALTWIDTLPDALATARNAAISATVAGWAKTDPSAALAYVQSAPDPSVYLGAAPALAAALSKSNPQAALNWVDSLPEGTAKDKALSNVLTSFAASDFGAAWSYAANLTSRTARDTAMTGLVVAQAKKDPAQAATLLGQLPPTDQISTTGNVAAAWALQDSRGATQWVAQLPPGEQRDAAFASALKAVQASKLPKPQRDVLVLRLNQIETGK